MATLKSATPRNFEGDLSWDSGGKQAGEEIIELKRACKANKNEAVGIDACNKHTWPPEESVR